MSNGKPSQSFTDIFYRQAIDALVAAAGEHDSMAEVHSERVRDYATAMGERLGLSREEIKNLAYAASLHDVGKVAISGRILNKLGRLTDEEVNIMRQHSLVATRILEKIDGLRNAIPAIKHHHERFDGDGYPAGLAGEAIPLGARIIAVAEAYDILTSDVPWRNALSAEAAMQEIERCSGTQFDPRIVAVLRSAIDSVRTNARH